jgi:hypothetical protein
MNPKDIFMKICKEVKNKMYSNNPFINLISYHFLYDKSKNQRITESNYELFIV